jgi:hypothetical protein
VSAHVISRVTMTPGLAIEAHRDDAVERDLIMVDGRDS